MFNAPSIFLNISTRPRYDPTLLVEEKNNSLEFNARAQKKEKKNLFNEYPVKTQFQFSSVAHVNFRFAGWKHGNRYSNFAC